jgi:hypothetical protein
MTAVAQTAPKKLTAVARLMLRVLASNLDRPRTLLEIERLTPCSHASASILTRRLESAGLLKSFAPEFGVPRTYTIASVSLLTSPTSPLHDEPLATLLRDLEPTVTKPLTWAEVHSTLLALVGSEPVTEGELILQSGLAPAIVTDWLFAAGANRQIATECRELTAEETFNSPLGVNALKTYTLI